MSVCHRAIPSVGRLPAWCSRVSAAQPSRSTTAPSMRSARSRCEHAHAGCGERERAARLSPAAAGYGSLRRATCSTGTQAPCSALRAKSCTACAAVALGCNPPSGGCDSRRAHWLMCGASSLCSRVFCPRWRRRAFRYGAGGTRWIMTVFFYVDTNASGREPGYALRAVSPDASSDDT
jgi:hypothetical protein